MSRDSKSARKNTKICLLGVSFDTGNMGVSALAESSIKIIINRWPDAEVTMLGTGITDTEGTVEVSGRHVRVKIRRLRFCKNIFLRSHCLTLLASAMLIRLVPLRAVRALLARANPYVKMLLETDKAFDITGGDSFSDIYGMRRFLIFGFLQKWLITQYRRDLVLLPQTYGPWSRPVTRLMARLILRRSGVIYARDHASVREVKDLLGNQDVNGKVCFMPDVAFVLDSREPESIDVGRLREVRNEDSVVVGLNISGLLFNGGYTQENMFSLKSDYRQLVYSAVESLMKDQNVLLLLVPHVFTPHRPVEDDPCACAEVYEKLRKRYRDRVFLTKGRYNHTDIKYVIGLCDFFIGSRMHACIAALSQCIPAVGIAYSRKFNGVFESIGLGECVAEAYQRSGEQILSVIETAFQRRKQTTEHLKEVIPGVKAEILGALKA